MEWNFSPGKIKGELVQLEPLDHSLIGDICEAMIPDPSGWYARMFGLDTKEAYEREVESSKQKVLKKTGMGFAIRDLSNSQIVGISSFLTMDRENRTLEIGTTNIAPKFRRTHVNTATKLLMLRYAFESLNCIRVSFRVDEENVISRKAIERLGAKYGGLLRNERILPDGRIRNYCFYSIIATEWPETEARLAKMLLT